jgi:hypothetical protein
MQSEGKALLTIVFILSVSFLTLSGTESMELYPCVLLFCKI